jgi:hypothetical protein
MDRDTFLALASALEDLGRAGSVARGGQRNSGQFYQTLAEAGQKAEQRKIDEKKAQAEMVRQSVLDKYKANEEQRAQAKFESEAAVSAEDKDPNSEKSRVAQDLAKKLMPTRDFSGMSAAQLKTALPTLEKMYTIDENNRARQENAQLMAGQRMETRDLNRTLQEQDRERKQSELMDKKTTAYSEVLQKTNIPSAVATIENVERLLPKTGDIPGYGRVAGMLPDFAVSKEGEDLRQAVSSLFNIELKDRSGAAVTDQELNRLRKEFGEGSWKSDDQLRKGIEQYKNRLREVIRNIEAGFDPQAKQVYQERGGRDFGKAIGEPSDETKTIGGKRFRKVQGGWEEIK